ncbi:MAG: methionine gamma-lyase family protein [Bacillota bacterium]|nr:methionine gamma-lyase family protein [Bacillota bacterium]
MKTFQQLEEVGLTAVESWYKRYMSIELRNQKKVLDAFRSHRINYQHFHTTSGYGMGDTGRDTLESLWSEIFQAEDSLIRQQIVSGTHAISLALFAMALPGDEIVFYGPPYDTLFKVLGDTDDAPGTLREMGVSIKIHPFGKLDTIFETVTAKTKVLYLQRSKGYVYRNAMTIEEIQKVIEVVKAKYPRIIVFVDNCYGEFTEKREPLEVGADLIAGSLIKNPGGAIAPSGGYLAGRSDLIERASYRLTAPGIGKEVGPSLISNVYLYHGVFMAPHVVAEALKGTVYISAVLNELGYSFLPALNDVRSDIVEAIRFNDPEKMKSFCRGIQKYSPVDSHVYLEAWDMPGYNDKVIMASGGFVEGSSIELSADGPLRPPYVCFVQGGTSFPYIKIVMDSIIQEEWGIE